MWASDRRAGATRHGVAGVRKIAANGSMRSGGVLGGRADATSVVEEVARDDPETRVPTPEGMARRAGVRLDTNRAVRIPLHPRAPPDLEADNGPATLSQVPTLDRHIRVRGPGPGHEPPLGPTRATRHSGARRRRPPTRGDPGNLSRTQRRWRQRGSDGGRGPQSVHVPRHGARHHRGTTGVRSPTGSPRLQRPAFGNPRVELPSRLGGLMLARTRLAS